MGNASILIHSQTEGTKMTISMYQASVPRLINALTNLSNVLQKAHDHMTEKKIDANAILHYRL